MKKHVNLVWNIDWSISLFFTVAHPTLLQDNYLLNFSWDDKLGTVNKTVEEQQWNQKWHHDNGRVELRAFKLDEAVLVRNWRHGVERWIPGRITQVKGPPTYLVRCGNQERFVHVRSLEEDRKPVFKFWFWGERHWLRERGWGVPGQEDVWCWCSSGITSRCFQYSRSWGLSWPRKHGEFASSQEDASTSDGRYSRESEFSRSSASTRPSAKVS